MGISISDALVLISFAFASYTTFPVSLCHFTANPIASFLKMCNDPVL